MAYFERTESCPADVSVVHVGPWDVEIPESGQIPVRRAVADEFAVAAEGTGFFRKVNDDPTPEDEAEDREAEAKADEPQVSELPPPHGVTDPAETAGSKDKPDVDASETDSKHPDEAEKRNKPFGVGLR